MTGLIQRLLKRFGREERGTATVEFVLVAPLFIAFLVFSVELGMVTLRTAMIERGLDIAVRDVRLGSGAAPDHDEIKQIVCDRAAIIPNCNEKLRLEMRPTDIRNFNPLGPTPDCTDASDPTKPLRDFVPGGQNRLTLMRACLKYRPIFPQYALGRALETDSNGEAAITATSSFVQEPAS